MFSAAGQGDGQTALLAKIGDLGIAEHVCPRLRTIAAHHYGTSSYRAPELVRGAEFDESIDLWSLGLIFFEFARGRNLTIDPTLKDQEWTKAIQAILATVFPAHAAAVRRQLGWSGYALTRKLLSESPAARGSAADAADYPYFHPSRLRLQTNCCGSTALRGHRSDYSLALGEFPPERLYKIQQEVRTEVLEQYLVPWLAHQQKPANVTLEDENCQFVVHGNNKTLTDANTRSICGMSIATPGAVNAHADFVEAFRRTNKGSYGRLSARFHKHAPKLPPAARGHANTKHLLETDLSTIACLGNQEQFALKSSSALDWKPPPCATIKPLHYDGANSLLQLGTTTFGERDVSCWAENPRQTSSKNKTLVWSAGAPEPEAIIRNRPGSLYFGPNRTHTHTQKN